MRLLSKAAGGCEDGERRNQGEAALCGGGGNQAECLHLDFSLLPQPRLTGSIIFAQTRAERAAPSVLLLAASDTEGEKAKSL